MKKLKRRKAIGIDKIPNEFIIEGDTKLWNCLRKNFNIMLDLGELPQEWCEKRVKLLHKGSKKDELDNYRPISFSSNISKVFTRVVANRLNDRMEMEDWLGQLQNGFRGKRSTLDNLFVITSIMEMAKKKKSKLFLSFIDLRKAYGTVNQDKLWVKLKEVGLNEKEINIIKLCTSRIEGKSTQ